MISRLVLQWKYSEKEIFKGKKKVHLTHYILSELFLLHRDNKCFLKWEHFMLCISFVSCTCCCILTGVWGGGTAWIGSDYHWMKVTLPKKQNHSKNAWNAESDINGHWQMCHKVICHVILFPYNEILPILKVTLWNHLHSHHIMIKLKTILLDRRLGQN